MSIGGGDDIEDELRRLNDRIEELEELMEAIFLEQEPEEEEDIEELVGQEDLWSRGQISDQARDLNEYREMRRRAARSEDFTVPYFGNELREDKVENYVTLFVSGFESLDSLKSPLNDTAWKKAIVEIFIASRIAGAGPFNFTFEVDGDVRTLEVSQEEMALLFERANVRPNSFGITEDVRGDVKFFSEASPMAVVKVYDTYWFSQTPPRLLEDIAKPWDSLGLEMPEEVEVSLRSDNPIGALVERNIIQGGRVPLDRFVMSDILPKGLRAQERGRDIPDVFNEMAELIERQGEEE